MFFRAEHAPCQPPPERRRGVVEGLRVGFVCVRRGQAKLGFRGGLWSEIPRGNKKMEDGVNSSAHRVLVEDSKGCADEGRAQMALIQGIINFDEYTTTSIVLSSLRIS